MKRNENITGQYISYLQTSRRGILYILIGISVTTKLLLIKMYVFGNMQ